MLQNHLPPSRPMREAAHHFFFRCLLPPSSNLNPSATKEQQLQHFDSTCIDFGCLSFCLSLSV